MVSTSTTIVAYLILKKALGDIMASVLNKDTLCIVIEAILSERDGAEVHVELEEDSEPEDETA